MDGNAEVLKLTGECISSTSHTGQCLKLVVHQTNDGYVHPWDLQLVHIKRLTGQRCMPICGLHLVVGVEKVKQPLRKCLLLLAIEETQSTEETSLMYLCADPSCEAASMLLARLGPAIARMLHTRRLTLSLSLYLIGYAGARTSAFFVPS